MKNTIKSYFSFSRTERIGIITLSCIILSLLAIRVTMHLWVHPPDHTVANKRLQAAWEHFKADQPTEQADTIQHTNDKEAYTDNGATLPDIININTADSATLVKLKGIGPAKASTVVAYRAKNGLFKTVEAFRDVTGVSDNIFNVLKPHLSVQ